MSARCLTNCGHCTAQLTNERGSALPPRQTVDSARHRSEVEPIAPTWRFDHLQDNKLRNLGPNRPQFAVGASLRTPMIPEPIHASKLRVSIEASSHANGR